MYRHQEWPKPNIVIWKGTRTESTALNEPLWNTEIILSVEGWGLSYSWVVNASVMFPIIYLLILPKHLRSPRLLVRFVLLSLKFSVLWFELVSLKFSVMHFKDSCLYYGRFSLLFFFFFVMTVLFCLQLMTVNTSLVCLIHIFHSYISFITYLIKVFQFFFNKKNKNNFGSENFRLLAN